MTDGPALVKSPLVESRVLVVEQGEGLWGAQRYLLRLAPLLRSHGVEQVLAAPAGSEIAREWRRQGWLAVDLPTPADRSVRLPSGRLSPVGAGREAVRTMRMARRLARLARASGADLIQANSHWSHLEAVLAGLACRLPVVLHLHEESRGDLLGGLRAVAVLAAARSIAVSDAVARSLPRFAQRRVVVIRNGIDATTVLPGPADPVIRAQLARDTGAPVVLSVSRLDVTKGIDKTIAAVAALPAHLSRTQLAVVGSSALDPAHAEHLQALGERLLGDRVRFLGPRDDVFAIMRAADVMVLASELEGLPLSILEAQACGLPVVAFPTSGVPEIVVDGSTGILAEPTVPALTAGLERVLADPGLAQKLAEQARAAVTSEHSLQQQAERQALLCQQLLAPRGT